MISSSQNFLLLLLFICMNWQAEHVARMAEMQNVYIYIYLIKQP
jgi:hypothetical protein